VLSRLVGVESIIGFESVCVCILQLLRIEFGIGWWIAFLFASLQALNTVFLDWSFSFGSSVERRWSMYRYECSRIHFGFFQRSIC
jgi:hypothetical protein